MRQRPRPSRTRLSATVALVAAAVTLGAVPLAGPAAASTAAAPTAATTSTPAVQPLASFDLNRYLGSWRQIADIPQVYEALCAKDTRAQYSLNRDGTVKVDNRCSGPLGIPIQTVGTARVLDPAVKASLQVSFVSVFGSPVYFNRTPNYVVLGVGSDYSWAVVGSPTRSTAYILSRTATLPAASLTAAKAVLSGNGYDPCSLTITPQTGGATRSGPLC